MASFSFPSFFFSFSCFNRNFQVGQIFEYFLVNYILSYNVMCHKLTEDLTVCVGIHQHAITT